ncbi:hypothetical protein [Telmatospirillum siberiense]|uniref:Uncharacterized protein n=1 Tax=Telmatospirillum siberiense TaxID=382514 RepID=A0A2N3PNN3_9PROT|nr:hypothetical protein [Telmatospirillum siberiense]PKU21997.1 hypothetical protein CWS72_24135 [Telmatospirillum siberiense]
MFRKTCALNDLVPQQSSSPPPTLPPVTESFARMRLECAQVQQGVANGEIKSWGDFEAALDMVGVDHLLIAGENAKGEPVWTSWVRNRKTGEIVACVSVYKTFTMRALVKSFGPHPKWDRAGGRPSAKRKASNEPKFIVLADDAILVEQSDVRVPAGIGIGELPSGVYDLDLGERTGTVMIHPDGARVYYDGDRQPIRVVAGSPSAATVTPGQSSPVAAAG